MAEELPKTEQLPNAEQLPKTEELPEIEQASPGEERTAAVITQRKLYKVADTPHWITIVLGLLSPTLAIVALLMSYLSYRTAQNSFSLSEQSLQTGQRAYLQSAIELGAPIDEGDKIVWQVKVKLHNSGNTPASKRDKSTQLSVAPGQQSSDALDAGAKEVVNAVVWPSEDQDLTVGAKEDEEFDLGEISSKKEVWQSNYRRYLSRGRTLIFQISITVNYVDVFNLRHATTRICDYLPSDDSTMKLVGCSSSGT